MASHLTDDCIFCKIIRGQIPSFKLVDTEKTYAFLDIGPLSKGHCLVIPKCASIRLAPTVTRLAEEGSLAAAQTTARSCTTSLMTTSQR